MFYETRSIRSICYISGILDIEGFAVVEVTFKVISRTLVIALYINHI